MNHQATQIRATFGGWENAYSPEKAGAHPLGLVQATRIRPRKPTALSRLKKLAPVCDAAGLAAFTGIAWLWVVLIYGVTG